MNFDTQYTVTYETHRCFTCGSFWAFETSRYSTACTCPKCAGDQINKMRGLMLAAERSAISLKGAATKLRKK